MAYSTINKSTDYFNTKLWTGNGSTQNITGIGHTPNFVWIKKRTDADGARIFDTVRTATKAIFTNSTAAETTVTSELSAFGSDGYTLGASDAVNGNTKKYVGWNWKANGAGSANTDGTISSTVSANTTAGFSIVSYTGNGTSGATVGHGLGAVPKMIIIKQYSSNGGTENWVVYHASLGNTKRVSLNLTEDETTDSAVWNNTTPTSSVFSLGNSDKSNNNTVSYIAYCFAEKTGYSKFSSYTGMGGTNYPFIYTGFKPAFVMAKRTNDTSNWVMYDNKRQYNLIEGQYNPQRPRLASNLSAAESSFTSDNGVDLLSNGFVVRDNSSDAYTINISGSTYIYMAFGQSIVGSNNIPTTAR